MVNQAIPVLRDQRETRALQGPQALLDSRVLQDLRALRATMACKVRRALSVVLDLPVLQDHKDSKETKVH